MFSARIGGLLKQARQELALSRDELARRGRVSTRLIAELERGQRPNVSLETTLHLLSVVGVTVVAQTPNGETAEMRSPAADAIARAARAAEDIDFLYRRTQASVRKLCAAMKAFGAAANISCQGSANATTVSPLPHSSLPPTEMTTNCFPSGRR